MPGNLPEYTTDNLSVGPGEVWVAPVHRFPYDTADAVGAVVSGMNLVCGGEVVDLRQGFPRVLIESWRAQDDVTFNFEGFEWKLDRLTYYLGAGSYSTTKWETGNQFYSFGGQTSITECSIRCKHEFPVQVTGAVADSLVIDIWRCRPAGETTFTLGDDPHSYPLSFEGMDCATEWDGSGESVPSGAGWEPIWAGANLVVPERLFRLSRLVA